MAKMIHRSKECKHFKETGEYYIWQSRVDNVKCCPACKSYYKLESVSEDHTGALSDD